MIFNNSKPIRYIDLFSGIGGFRYALQNAAERFQLKTECVLSSEIDKECQRAYAENFGEVPSDDITAISSRNIPDHHLLLAGFPCQPFSIIGNKKGFDDTRGTLFFDIARILEAKRPEAFVLENVKLLTGHDNGKTFTKILMTLDKLGYHVTHKTLNALDFGLPQKRERVFIVGFKKPCHFEWPIGKVPMIPLADILEKEVPRELYASERIQKKRLSKHQPTSEPTIWHENKSGNISALPYSCALRAGASYNYLLVNGKRRLSSREMLRLQGFPEDFKIVCNYSQTRKQAGNSLPIPVAQAVIEHTISSLNNYSTDESTPVYDKLIINGQYRIFERSQPYNEITSTS